MTILSNLREKSMLHLILGGAAVHRCDNLRISTIGFSRCGATLRAQETFPQSREDWTI
ncbi:MAG: hypothetical protein WCF61_12235 [Terriglobales bacterium]